MSQTKVLSVAKATVTSLLNGAAGQGCGNSKRLYVGRIGTRDYKSHLEFTMNWTDVGKIVKATLVVYTDDLSQRVTSLTTPKAYIRLNTTEFVEGNNGDEVFNATDYTAPKQATANQVLATLNIPVNEVARFDITKHLDKWAPKSVKTSTGAAGTNRGGAFETNHGIALIPYSNVAANRWSGWSEDSTDASKRPTIELEYELGSTIPDVPTSLAPSGAVASGSLFAGAFSDPRPTDTLASTEIEIYTNAASAVGQVVSGGSRVWQQVQSASATEIANAVFGVVPSGLNLATELNYKWRARVTDQEGQTSPWTALVTFSVSNTNPDAPTVTPNGSTYATLAGVHFTGTFSDDDDDALGAYQIQLAVNSPSDVLPALTLWDTGKVYLAGGQLSVDAFYSGPGLDLGLYHWRMRVWDVRGGVSAWSSIAAVTLSADFEVEPGTETRAQYDPRAPFRIIIRDMVDQTAPTVALIQSAASGSGNAQVLQEVYANSPGSADFDISLDSAPASGSTLIMMVFVLGGLAGWDPTAGVAGSWTQGLSEEGYDVTQYGGPGERAGLYSFYRLAGGAETGIEHISPGGGTAQIGVYLAEIDGGAYPPPQVSVADTITSAAPATLGTTGTGMLLVGYSVQRTSYAPPDAFAPNAGTSERLDTVVIDRPDVWIGTASGTDPTVSATISANPNLDKFGRAGVGYFFASGSEAVLPDGDPTVGNLLVSWGTGISAAPPLPAGFTNIGLVQVSATVPHRYGRMAYRVVQAGDSDTWSSAGYKDFFLMEWRGSIGVGRTSTRHVATTAFRAGGNITPTPHVPCVILGAGVIGFSNSPTVSVTPLASTTELRDEFGSAAPGTFIGYQAWDNPTGQAVIGGLMNNSVKYGGVTITIIPHSANRGPNEVVAILEDAKSVGASVMYNSPGELHFTLPISHPQLGAIEPKRTHYAVEMYQRNGWREVFAGMIWDADATEKDVVFTGVDYLGLFETQKDRRFTVNAIDKPYNKGGSYYNNVSVRTIVIDQIDQAIHRPNSPVNFITRGAIATMNEPVTIHSTMESTLSFIGGLLNTHRQGQNKRTQIKVIGTFATGYSVTVVDDPGVVKPDLRMQYGELVQGYRIILFGPNWASFQSGIGRQRDGTKVLYFSKPAAGVNPATWGDIGNVQFFDGVSDQNDLNRRLTEAANIAGKIGKQVGLGIRTAVLPPRTGYDVTDFIPVGIVHGAIDTTDYAGTHNNDAYWDIFGIAWEVSDLGAQETILTLSPHEDATTADPDLLSSEVSTGRPEWDMGWGAPDAGVQTSLYYLDQSTGIIYIRRDDGSADDDPSASTNSDEADQVDP